MSDTSAIYRLADFAHDLRLDEIPSRIRRQGELSILDTLGCILAGAATDDAALLIRAENIREKTGKCSVAGTGLSLPAQEAARLNGYMGDIFELNDLTGGHASIGIVPAALAMAEETGASGRDLLLACIAGIEVTTRIYNAVYPAMKSYNECGMGPVGFPDTVGAAAAVSVLLKLDRMKTRAALAIAAGMAGWNPVEATSGPGSTIKALFHGGWPASVALLAAQYAEAGVTGPEYILEGPTGYFSTVSNGADMAAIDSSKWALAAPRRKLHASCGYTHSALDVAKRLHEQDPAILGDARTIEIRMPPYVMPVVVKEAPPSTPNEARFHTRYVIAVTASGHGAIAPDHSENFARYLSMPEVRDLYQKIGITPDPALNHYHKTLLRIEQPDGTIIEESNSAPKGSPNNPLTDEEVIAKFMSLAVPIIGQEAASALQSGIDNLASCKNLEILSALLRGEHGRLVSGSALRIEKDNRMAQESI